MAHVLIAWELGTALGRLTRCLRLAQAFVARGHRVTLALKDVRLPTGLMPSADITVVAAPLTLRVVVSSNPPVNYADVLLASGFAHVEDVVARLRAWQGLFSLARPDVMITDHAPTALLAARLAGIPHLAIGNGFAIPPAVAPWPSIRPRETVSDQALAAAETRLDHVLEAAQKALGHTRAVRARDLFGKHDILDTFAELDHYGARPEGRYVGPIVSAPKALRVDWQSQEGPHVLAYLRPVVPGFQTILQVFSKLDAEVLCVAPGLSRDAAKQFATRRLRIALVPLDLPPLLEHTDLVVNYGSSGFSTLALLAGVPLGMRPWHVEQALFALRVEALGAGRRLDGQLDVDGVITSLQELLDNPSYRQAARAFRSRHADYSPSQAVEQSLFLIERMFSSPACLH